MRPAAFALLVTVAVLADPAVAADRTVAADGFSWSPASVDVTAGDTVTWKAPDGPHDLFFSDGAAGRAEAGAGWSVPRRFDAPGAVRFRCTIHSTSFTDGMSGAVTVRPAPSPYVQTPAAPTPSGPSAGPGVTPAPALIASVRVRVKRRIATATIRLGGATRITGTLARRPLQGRNAYRSLGAIRPRHLAAGTRRFVVQRRAGGRRLARGRYRLRIITRGDRLTVTFRVT